MNNDFLAIFKQRRSIYALDKKVNLTEEEITSLITQSFEQAPAAFNTQTTRIAILFNQQHNILWNIVEATLKDVVPAENFSPTAQKIMAFRQAYGTILYFEDQQTIKALQQQAPTYASSFPEWSLENQGIALFCIWTALATQQIGASIQHYNPLIDNDVKQQWQLPESWRLLGQMPFGHIIQQAATKSPIDSKTLIKVFK